MNYEITEEQIKELAKGNAKVKKWFPEVFETKFKSGWYKFENKPSDWWLGFIDENFNYYGFNEKIWFNQSKHKLISQDKNSYTPATDSEVEEALINEAKKREFVKGAYINGLGIFSGLASGLDIFGGKGFYYYDSEFNTMYINRDEASNIVIFNKGKWAEIVKTYTKEEAEKLLNAKII